MYQAVLVPNGDSDKLCYRLFPPFFSLRRSLMPHPVYEQYSYDPVPWAIKKMSIVKISITFELGQSRVQSRDRGSAKDA